MLKSYFLTTTLSFCALAAQAQQGCTDPLATNYDSLAVTNDGSCLYAATTIPSAAITSHNLPTSLNESSGLFWWDNLLWTHNDNTDTILYALDTLGAIQQTMPIQLVSNIDWEDVDSDSGYIYIGDFGNNAQGNRQNLRIYKRSKTDSSQVDTISFYYPEQADFSAQGGNNTNFDCEAMFATADSIYIFTKRWLDAQTMLYAIANQSGMQVAELRDSLDVAGLVTGACYLEDKNIVALCGYSSNYLQPFIYLLYDFEGQNFFSGNKRKLQMPTLAHQIEGITSADGLRFYLSNEYASSGPLTVPAKLHRVDLSAYLGDYLAPQPTGLGERDIFADLQIYPNPAKDVFWLRGAAFDTEFELSDGYGRRLQQGQITNDNQEFRLPKDAASGLYILRLKSGNASRALPIIVR